MNNNPYLVGPGWWHLLDLEIPQLYEIDPDLTALEIKEKYGACQVDCWPSETHKIHADLLADVASAIESQSATICENCGEHTGVKTTPETPYCERCLHLPTAERFAVRERTREEYFRGSHARHGEPQGRGEVREKKLKAFLEKVKYFRICRVRCKLCGDVLEYRPKSREDRGPGRPMMCSCGKVGLDPSACLYRVLGEPEHYEDLSEEWTETI